MSWLLYIVSWIIGGAIMGWLVSLALGRDFRGGWPTYVGVGIITMFALGLVLKALKLLWVLFVIAVIVVAGAWLWDTLRGKRGA